MERKQLESAVADATYLRGLLAIPLGLLFILTGLGNLRWGPFAHTWVFLVSLLAIGSAYLLITRYYNDHYGRVTPTKRRQVRYNVISFVLFATGLAGGSFLDFRLDLPISIFVISFALAMLAWFAICVRLRAHHLIVWGLLLAVGLLPVWDTLPDRVSVAWLPIGVATITAGILDHLALRRTFGPAKRHRVEAGNAGA
jgi:hypothetical protein